MVFCFPKIPYYNFIAEIVQSVYLGTKYCNIRVKNISKNYIIIAKYMKTHKLNIKRRRKKNNGTK